MGEQRQREEASLSAMEALAAPQAQQINLTGPQAAVVFALQRMVSMLSLEAKQLTESYGQREAAGELAGAVEHLNKFAARYIADAQRSIVIAAPKVVLK